MKLLDRIDRDALSILVLLAVVGGMYFIAFVCTLIWRLTVGA